MTITLELPPHLEARLRERAAHQDAATVRRLLAEAAEPVAERLLREADTGLSDAEFERVADLVAEEFAANVGMPAPILSDEAVSREGIYGEHP